MKVDEARFCAGYVLRGVEEDMLISDTPNYYGIVLDAKQDIVSSVVVYISQKHVFQVYDDVSCQSKYTYDMVLTEPYYNVFYSVGEAGIQKQQMVSRDLICDWYYKSHICVESQYYDLMRVPLNLLSVRAANEMYRSLSWQSFLIQPGLMVTISIRNSDIRYVPKSCEVDGYVVETRKLEDYVNVNLSESVYDVSYKSAATGWRTKVESVEEYLIVKDYLSFSRANLNRMSLSEWMSYVRDMDVVLT